jgi:pimeloyl-ACP methyl ester carboxylesterase
MCIKWQVRAQVCGKVRIIGTRGATSDGCNTGAALTVQRDKIETSPAMTKAFLTAIAILATIAIEVAANSTRSAPRADGGQTPLKVYDPAGRSCPDTLIFSHGLGGDETAGAAIASTLNAAGWRVLVMGHAESGRASLRQALTSGDIRGGLAAQATDASKHRARMLDLDAAWTESTRSCRPQRIVLAGHSMGAVTTMLEAGAVARFGALGRDRFDAYVALSPQGVGVFWDSGAWRGVRKPTLMISGTNDRGIDGEASLRKSAFDNLPSGTHRWAVLDGATHLDVSGKSAPHGAIIAQLILDFLARKPSSIRGVSVVNDK